MSIEIAFRLFVRPMAQRFTVPHGLDPEVYLEDVAEELAEFSERQLSLGAKHFTKNRTQRSFPTIAECRAVCAGIHPHIPVFASEEHPTQGSEESLFEARRRKAVPIVRGTELAKRAEHEGWLPILLDYAGDHGELPTTAGEIAKLRRQSAETDAASRKFNGALSESFKIWRQAMHDKARRLLH